MRVVRVSKDRVRAGVSEARGIVLVPVGPTQLSKSDLSETRRAGVTIVRRLDMGITGGLGMVRGECVLKTGCGCEQKAGCEYVRSLGVEVTLAPDSSIALVPTHSILRHLISKPVRGWQAGLGPGGLRERSEDYSLSFSLPQLLVRPWG